VEAVIKVGGNLAETPEVLRAVCKTLGQLARMHQILVVPGGGEFADLVRDIDMRYSLPPITAHRMAVLSMDQYAFLLSELTPNSERARNLGEIEEILGSNKAAVLLPSQLILEESSLESSWDVTSDSIAAYIADRLHARKLILITDVDGIFTYDPKTRAKARLLKTTSASELLKHGQRTCVDRFLPVMLLKTKFDCYIINGNHPQRIVKILANERTIGTQILTK